MRLTIRSITGHLAMSNTITAEDPRPTRLPTCRASPPVEMTANALTVSKITVTTVTPSRIGTVFQIGLPSSTSQTTFDARMKAEM